MPFFSVKRLVLASCCLLFLSCAQTSKESAFTIEEASVEDIQQLMREGQLSATVLVQAYLDLIAQYDTDVKSII